MRERLYRVQAIVLKRTDIGEADRLLTLYTPERGKLRAVAKGARKTKSRKSGHIELFTHCALQIAKGKQIDIITQADTLDAYMPLRDNLDRVSYAYYLAELVDQFIEEAVENDQVFDLLKHALGWLGDAHTDAELLARYFELQLLTHVGYRPQLFACINCGKPIEPMDNFFSAEAGGVLDPACAVNSREHTRDLQPITLGTLKILRYVQTREWATVRVVRLIADEQSVVETLMYRYIAHHLERNLKSVEFLHTLKFQNRGQ